MKLHRHRCPVSWYIGQFFADQRKSMKRSLTKTAQMVETSTKYLRYFEQGKIEIDALFVMKLEKFYGIDFSDYKPPVDYFGFLGMTCNEEDILLLNKMIVRKLQKVISNESALSVENKLLKLRYSPLRGRMEELS